MIGEVIGGRYRLLRVLGQGGMGAVYEAEHTGTGRHVAVKVILELAKSPGAVPRFEREARAAGSIDTQHIVQVFDTGTDPTTGTPYMVMELLKGEDLAGLLKRLGPLPPDLALRLVGQACVGLAKAHQAGVVHRDIKPANLYLSLGEDGNITVKLVDFGVAKLDRTAMTAEDASLTRTGSLLGSPLYMSPEQATSKKTLDRRTDIWSLGVVLYQALAGRVPHAECESLGSLIMAICTERPPPLQNAAPWVAPEVVELVEHALALKVEERLPSAEAMLEAIQKLVPRGLTIAAAELVPLSTEMRAHIAPRHEPLILGATVTSPGSTTTTSPGTSQPPVHATSRATPGGSSRRSLVGPVLGTVAVLGIAAMALLRGTQTPVTQAALPLPVTPASAASGPVTQTTVTVGAAPAEPPAADAGAPVVTPGSTATATAAVKALQAPVTKPAPPATAAASHKPPGPTAPVKKSSDDIDIR